MENQEHLTLIHSLIKTHAFNGYTLVSTKYWQTPSVSDISVVRGLIPLTDLGAGPPAGGGPTNYPQMEIRSDTDGVHHLVLSVLAGRAGHAAG